MKCIYCGERADECDCDPLEPCPHCDQPIPGFQTSPCPHCGKSLIVMEDDQGRLLAPDDRLRSPYPFFGTKKKVVHDLWRLFGDVKRYVEPFLGSAAMLLAKPKKNLLCVVNDKSRYISNFWRAVQEEPEEVWRWCDWPVSHADLEPRHVWLEQQPLEWLENGNPDEKELLCRLRQLEEGLGTDPLWYDPKVAGWWCWGQSCWVAGGWCTGKATTQSSPRRPEATNGRGVHANRPFVSRKIGVQRAEIDWPGYFRSLQEILRPVIVCCGSWDLVTTNAVLDKSRSPVGVFLDPPYKVYGEGCYGRYHSEMVSTNVRDWAVEAGRDRRVKIMLCGYEGEHEMPNTWKVYTWDHDQGMNKGHSNKGKERVWCSPGIDVQTNLATVRLAKSGS